MLGGEIADDTGISLQFASHVETAIDLDDSRIEAPLPSPPKPIFPERKPFFMHLCRDRRHQTGITRRELLQVGFSGLAGIGLQNLLAAQSRASSKPGAIKPRAKRVVLIF